MKELAALLGGREVDPSPVMQVLQGELRLARLRIEALQEHVDREVEPLLRDIGAISTPEDAYSATRRFDADWFEKTPYSVDRIFQIAARLVTVCSLQNIEVPTLWKALAAGRYVLADNLTDSAKSARITRISRMQPQPDQDGDLSIEPVSQTHDGG